MHITTISYVQTHTGMLCGFAGILLVLLHIINITLNSTDCGLIDLTSMKEEHAWCKLKRHFRKLLFI